MRLIGIVITCFVLSAQKLCAQLSYYQDIEPIIQAKCFPCHAPDNAAPIDLSTKAKVIRQANIIKYVIRTGYMPPWPADPHFSSFANEKMLTDLEKGKLLAWIDQKDKSDKKSNTGRIARASENTTNEPFLGVEMKEKYLIDGNGKDNIAQFLIPIKLDKDSMVRKIEFIPGNRKAIHHANFLIFGDSMVDKSRLKYYTQVQPLLETDIPFIDPIPAKDLLYYGGWLPGTDALTFPPGFGFILPKSAYILLTIHYAPTSIDANDQSRLKFYFARDTVRRILETITFGSAGKVAATYPPLLIPPDSIMSFEIRHTFVKDFSLIYINPHMHLLGRNFEAILIFPNNDTIPLIKINNWGFRWQYFYQLRKVLKVPLGAQIIIKAKYDNTSNNPFNPYHPPRLIKEGVMTNNEMMSLIFVGAFYKDGDENIKIP